MTESREVKLKYLLYTRSFVLFLIRPNIKLGFNGVYTTQTCYHDLIIFQVLGNTYKKLYILEETPGDAKPLFGNVRQMESLYFMKNGSLYVDFLFR